MNQICIIYRLHQDNTKELLLATESDEMLDDAMKSYKKENDQLVINHYQQHSEFILINT